MSQTEVVEKSKHAFCGLSENRSVYQLILKEYGRAGQATDDNTIRHMRFACWVTKATDTHTECVVLTAFPLRQWLHERASLLRYTYVAFLC